MGRLFRMKMNKNKLAILFKLELIRFLKLASQLILSLILRSLDLYF